MGSTDESFSNTGNEPKDHFFTETFVESLTESMTEQRFPEQRFLEDVDHDDAAIGEMLFNAYREHSQRESLLVGRRRPCPIDRGNPLWKWWQKATIKRCNPLWKEVKNKTFEHAQIMTLLDQQREKIIDCQAEIRRHEFQADYDRRSTQKLSETIKSQQEELLLEQLLKQNWDLREAYEKSFTEMEELKKFQSSTFDTIARRRLVEDQDTILELTGMVR